MAEQLRSQGVQVDYLPLYRRLAPIYAEGQVLQTCRQHGLNGLVASSGEGLANLCASAAADWPQLAELPLFVPSPRVAEQARQAGARQVIDCRGASLQALLQALQKHAPDSSRTTG
jgi:uroporphyrinogen-III synthase